MGFLQSFLDIILPPFCLGCKKEGVFLCENCHKSIQQFPYMLCPICKRRDPEGKLDQTCRATCGLTRYIGAPLPYSNKIVQQLIHSFKYERAKILADPLSKILVRFLDRNNMAGIIQKQNVLLVPVPLYDFRERERGFNQATEIARRVGSHYKIEMAEQTLARTKNTKPQALMKNKKERTTNIAGAFSCENPLLIQRKIVVLVDDIYTSGATMRECASVLRTSGARQVWGLTVAR